MYLLFLDFIFHTSKMSDSKQGISKEGAVGKNMSGALAGQASGAISKNYKGMPRNADPHHPHNPNNSQSVADWTQNKMQECRKAAAEKK
jgi:hypothetical protein